MANLKLNFYRFEGDYVVGICSDGTQFKIDESDYERVKEYTWYAHRNGIDGTQHRKTISLSRFLLNVSDKSSDKKYKINFKNRNPLDLRKSNLFLKNEYRAEEDYLVGTCLNGDMFKIDKEDYELVSSYVWHVDSNGYLLTKINGRSIKQHRLILDVLNDNTFEVDHIYHDMLDNRKRNLRLVTRSQNCINERMPKTNTSGVKGVYWCNAAGKWAVQITAGKTRHYLGIFSDIMEAKAVRANAEKVYHKEYSCNV